MSTSPIFVATFADKVCTRMSINCTPDDLNLERGKTLAKYAYESRAGKPASHHTRIRPGLSGRDDARAPLLAAGRGGFEA